MPLLCTRKPLWIGITLSFYAFVTVGIIENGLGVLLPSILAAYNLTPATVTLLFLSQVIGYTASALSCSLLSSRIGLAQTLLLASITLISALFIYARAVYWSAMVACGVLLGLGIGCIEAGVNTYIANDQRNANMMGFLHAFYGIGALLGPALAAALLAVNWDWRHIYMTFAGLVVILILGMLWVVLYNYTPMTVQVTKQSTDAIANLRLALRTPAVLIAGLLLLVDVGMEASISNWAYSVQTVSRGTPELLAGYGVSTYGLGVTIGRLVLGRVMALLGAVRSVSCSLALLTAGLLVWWLLPSQLMSLLVIGFALGMIFPATIWLMPQRVPTQLVPGAISFITGVAGWGAAIIPTAVGWIANRVGLGSIPALMLPLVVLMIMLHLWLVQHAPTSAPKEK